MKLLKNAAVGLCVVLIASLGVAQAGTDLNEVAAFLVFPGVVAFAGPNVETYVTITNASGQDVDVHLSYINGEQGATECYECDFDIFLTGYDTETLLVTRAFGVTNIYSLDDQLLMACPHEFGFMTANVQDPNTGETLTSNVLLGEEVVIDYSQAMAISVPAVSFQGKNGGDGDRWFEFNDQEYGKMPKVVAADFLAPTADPFVESGYLDAALTLFTLGFERQFPPLVDCSVIGYDANEFPFSTSFQFGCWTTLRLYDIHPEFAYPFLGQIALDEHGWLKLNCRVDADNDGDFDAVGGVHGAITQVAGPGVDPARMGRYPMQGWAAWSRLLYQSVTTGDALTLHLEDFGAGLD